MSRLGNRSQRMAMMGAVIAVGVLWTTICLSAPYCWVDARGKRNCWYDSYDTCKLRASTDGGYCTTNSAEKPDPREAAIRWCFTDIKGRSRCFEKKTSCEMSASAEEARCFPESRSTQNSLGRTLYGWPGFLTDRLAARFGGHRSGIRRAGIF